MRVIPNPEKFNFSKITYKPHRVIIPVYIPDSDDFYFSSLFDVFKLSVYSLLKTINSLNTSVTIINNNCKKEVTDYIDKLIEEKKIDKQIKLSSNYGKVYTILSEAKGCYEPYITIADADVFYFNNWESEVFKILKTFPKVGVVSPVPSPHLFKYYNISFIVNNIFKLKKGQILTDRSFDLFAEGINHSPEFFRTKKNDFKKEQFYVEKNEIKACVGAMHFIATYDRTVFNEISLQKPEFKFNVGDEGVFIDSNIDKMGLGRLSTSDAYAYHLGYSIPNWTKEYQFMESDFIFTENQKKNSESKKRYVFYILKKIIYKLLKHTHFIKQL